MYINEGNAHGTQRERTNKAYFNVYIIFNTLRGSGYNVHKLRLVDVPALSF